MKNLFKVFTFILILFISNIAYAAKFSDEMKDFIYEQFPKSTIRFDGLIILQDGTLYLPLYPTLVKKPDKIEVKEKISSNPKEKNPEIIILNNDYVFMKVIKNKNGQKSLLYLKNPPLEVKTGLLPQDLLVPSELYIPDNIKGIMGNLEIPTIKDNSLKVELQTSENKSIKPSNINTNIPQLKNKLFYIVSAETKDIQVVKSTKSNAEYALNQDAIVYDFKATPDKNFLLITNYGSKILNVISLSDDMSIKQIDLTTDGGEILIDEDKNTAYISSPKDSLLYVLDINTMTLTKKIKLKGRCTKLVLTDKNRKIFYYDKKTNEIWSVELDNDFVTKYIGSFPNISKIEYANGKVYFTSRIANRLAVVDYETLNLMNEIKINEKPIDMLLYKNQIYILSAAENTIQILDIFKDEIVGEIKLNTEGFSTEIYRLDNSNYAIISDAFSKKYSIVDLEKNILINNYPLDIPVSKILILPEVRKN